jgi:DNA-binding transcriptional ArsR family regulator
MSTVWLNVLVNAAEEHRLDRTLLALADPTRRAILRRLMKETARVTDLAAPFDMSLNAISKHIRVLEQAGLVVRRVEGREHHLAFEPRPLDAAAEWIATQKAVWEPRLDALAAHLARRAGVDQERAPRRSVRGRRR